MAIIYTYPTKATPANDDLILISDSADSNKTKQVTVASIKGQTAGVTSIVAGNNVTISSTGASGTGDVTVNALGGGTFSVQDSGGTAITGIDTLDFNTNLSVSHSLGSSTVTINASGSGPGTGTEDTVPIWSTTSTLGDSLITQNAGATVLNVGTNIASFSTTAGVGSVFATRVSVNGYSTFGGKLKLNSPDGATFVEIEGPANGGAAYTLKLPSSAPGDNQILQYTTSGNLGWINTPTGSGGISFSGSTVSGIATFASTSSAAVNSEVKLLANGQMTFDGSSGNTGIKFDSSTNTLRVGDIVGNSDVVALYSDGAAKITVSDSDVLVADTTQFQQGLKFGASGETLDSYEEGSWTPTMFGAGSPTVTATGQYVKIGRNVTVWFSLVCTAGDTLAVARISGLPFNGQGASVYGHNGGASLSVNIGNSASVRYVTGTSGGATTLDLKVFTTSSITLNGPLPETENIDYQYSVGYWPTSQGNFTVRGTYTYKSQS